jgi:mRNA-degrading endonuclease RelE of RelBE toxin-antitoxin system
LNDIYLRIQADSSPSAAKWFNGLEDAIISLENLPERGMIVPRTRRRQLFYGNKPDVYRIVYSVDDKLKLVNVYYVRHGAHSKFH